MAYASGKDAWGISDRSGFRYRLRDMKKEWTGALVGPDEFEPKHPQLYPPRVGPDPQALRNPRPDEAEPLIVFVGIPLVELPNPTPIRGITQLGSVFAFTDVAPAVAGFAITSALGSVTITGNIDETATASGTSAAAGAGTVTITGNIDETAAASGVSATPTTGTVTVVTT